MLTGLAAAQDYEVAIYQCREQDPDQNGAKFQQWLEGCDTAMQQARAAAKG